MIINLKQIRILDTENEILDKINYNFDQLVSNGGGPKGNIGPIGQFGFTGFQGSIGYQGDIGVQGFQGIISDPTQSYWNQTSQIIEDDEAVLFATLSASISESITPAVYSGYISTDSKYLNSQIDDGSPKYQWVINRINNNVNANLRLTSQDILSNAFDITMDNRDITINGQQVLKKQLFCGFIDNKSSQLNLQAETHIIRSSSTGANLLIISKTGSDINVNSFFEEPVKFNKKITIENIEADVNKIVTSADTSGLITFKNSSEIGGSVRIGTIISILPSIFKDSSNFINLQSISTSLNPDEPIQIRIGAGVGEYQGWYVCNGEEWKNDTDSISYLAPDLNSYSYLITSNPISTNLNSQGFINVANNDIQLIGGSETLLNAYLTGGTQIPGSRRYGVLFSDESTESPSPIIQSNNVGTSISFKIKKLPQIVYLGRNDLYWSQLGEGQSIDGDYNSNDYNNSDYSI